MKNEQDMAAFEAAMKRNGYTPPRRGRVRDYMDARDQDRYDGWRMAMEANGDEREKCAEVCEDLPAPKDCTAAEESIWDVATMACAAAIRARGVK
jgi:hypothetical protein